MHAFFDDLGRTILKRWKQDNFSLMKFPGIALTALDARSPAKHVDLPKLMRDFMLNEDQPPQTDSDFGEPELIVYSHPRFYIQLLFWMDGTTEIHQHEFSGAFHVMHGSSIHAHYDFENAKSITPYIRVGDVRLKAIELLETGRTIPIVSGRQSIHSLFHLDSPSVTVVVRTQHDPGTGPQFNYLPPHIAIDPHFSDKLTMRRKQLLEVLEQTEDAGYADLMMEMIADLDFERGFSVLYHCMGYLQQLDQWTAVLRSFKKKHGILAAGVEATLAEDVRRNIIKNCRSTITEPEHRFFLALLMNVQTRSDLFKLVAKRFSNEKPIDVVLRWLEDLIEVTDESVTLLDASFPEMIDVNIQSKPELFLAALEYFTRGNKRLPPALRELSAIDLKELRNEFTASALSCLVVSH